MNFGTLVHVCMHVHVCVCVCVCYVHVCMCVSYFSRHACLRSMCNTTENGLHHAYETKSKTAS